MILDLRYVKYTKKLYIQSQNAEPSPPLGTVLGNLGVTTATFCSNFNLFTKNLPSYFLLKVCIFIYENKSTAFIVDLPPISFFLNFLKFEQILKIRNLNKLVFCIPLKEIIKLALLKFPFLALINGLSILFGSIKSMGLIVKK